MCFLLVAAYTGAIKSNLIKEPEPKLITQKNQIADSNIPIIFTADDYQMFEILQYSPYKFDHWLYEHVREVIPFTDQYDTIPILLVVFFLL